MEYIICSVNDKRVIRDNFDCGVSELNEYLKKYAKQNDNKGISIIYLAKNYFYRMIKSFRCKEIEKLFLRQESNYFPLDLQKNAQRKLLILDTAETLNDLLIPPGNRLEKLKGDRQDKYSIIINQKWRICFQWDQGNVFNIEIVDYH